MPTADESRAQPRPTEAGDTAEAGETAGAHGTDGSKRSSTLSRVISVVGLLVAAVAGFTVSGYTLWGLLPIALYAVLSISGMDIVLAKIVSLASALLILQSTPIEAGELMGTSAGDLITQIGIIIMLGAGVGEILRLTGVAENIVVAILRVTGENSRRKVQIGIMLACMALVACLGTLAGALAIAAPMLIPTAARVGFTRSATAAMMFIGGCAGLALAPFAGSNVAIMQAAGVDYLTYLRFGALPLAVVSIVMGIIVVPFVQRRSQGGDDDYDDNDAGRVTGQLPPHSRPATAVFVIGLAVSVVYATVTGAGTTFPLVALPVVGLCTGLAARLPLSATLAHFYAGARPMIRTFFMFWILAALFLTLDELGPFNVIVDRYGAELRGTSGVVFVVLIGLLGWVGIPGATAAQVVLINKVFGPIAVALGIPAGVWAIALLWGSKADTYGPFPTGNMVGAMGLARSSNLRSLLGVGWTILVPACLVYLAITWAVL